MIFALFMLLHQLPAAVFGISEYSGQLSGVAVSRLSTTRTVHYAPGQPTLVAVQSAVFLRDDNTTLPSNGTITLNATSDAGLYLSEAEMVRAVPSYLCSVLPLELYGIPPTNLPPSTTAILPCSIRGDPRPVIWWEVWSESVGWRNVSLSHRVFLSPLQHLVILTTMTTDSATYRCVAVNLCGARCPKVEETCRIGDVTGGEQIHLEISADFPQPADAIYLLHSTRDVTVSGPNPCLGGVCTYVDMQVRPGELVGLDAVFMGDLKHTNIYYHDMERSGKVDESGRCMVDCKIDGGAESTLCRPVASTSEVAGCSTVDSSETLYFHAQFFPDIDITANVSVGKLGENLTSIRFQTSQRLEKSYEIRCYHNLKVISAGDRRTSVQIFDESEFGIVKECPFREDSGGYFCIVTNDIENVFLSPIVTIEQVEKWGCREIRQTSQSERGITVTWDEPGVKLTYMGTPCNPGGNIFCEEAGILAVNGSTTAIIAPLSPGCCYHALLRTQNGLSTAENAEVLRTLKTLPSFPVVQPKFQASYEDRNKLRVRWEPLERGKWGDYGLYYRIERRNDSSAVEILTTPILTIDRELLPEGKMLTYGNLRYCNILGCTAETTAVTFFLPPRTNKPDISLKVGCRDIWLTVKGKDNDTYVGYEYTLNSVVKGEIIITKNVSSEGATKISHLKEGRHYALSIWGVSGNATSSTLLDRVELKTNTLCVREQLFLAGGVILLLLVASLVVKHIRERRKEREGQVHYYSAPIDLTAGASLADQTDPEITIIHADQGTSSGGRHLGLSKGRFIRFWRQS